MLEYHTRNIFRNVGEQLDIAEREDDVARNEGEGWGCNLFSLATRTFRDCLRHCHLRLLIDIRLLVAAHTARSFKGRVSCTYAGKRINPPCKDGVRGSPATSRGPTVPIHTR